MALGYPEPGKRGKYMNIWLWFRTGGPLVGGAIVLALNNNAAAKKKGKVGYQVYLVFIAITCNFPTQSPVTPENMNYTSAAVGIIMAIAAVTWITTGRKQFRGPESGGVMIGEEVVGIQPPIAVEVASAEQSKPEKQ